REAEGERDAADIVSQLAAEGRWVGDTDREQGQDEDSREGDKGDSAAQGTTQVGYSDNSTMIIVWDPQEGAVNPTFMFGHVSYILMQSNTSLSWEGWFNWTIDHPSSDYTNKRSEASAGMGYILDFGPKINAKFQTALVSAYKNALAGPGYNPALNNCAKA